MESDSAREAQRILDALYQFVMTLILAGGALDLVLRMPSRDLARYSFLVATGLGANVPGPWRPAMTAAPPLYPASKWAPIP